MDLLYYSLVSKYCFKGNSIGSTKLITKYMVNEIQEFCARYLKLGERFIFPDKNVYVINSN